MRGEQTVVFVLCLLAAHVASGQWTVNSNTPQVIGQSQAVGTGHVLAATPDGATWVAWVDEQCFGSLRVQRIAADGTLLTPEPLSFDEQSNCVLLTPQIGPLPDGSVVVRAMGTALADAPLRRLSATGQDEWSPTVVTAADFDSVVGDFQTLASGDTLIAGRHQGMLKVARLAPDGTPAWTPTLFGSNTGVNMRFIGLHTDGADGAYVLWDSPGAYTRRVRAQRLDATGLPAWAESELLIDIPPGSSRHTDPVVIADGTGASALLWTQGAESPSTPVPVRWQRVLQDGSVSLDASGARASTSAGRQYLVRVAQRAPGDDLFIAWREGPFDDLSLRVQRVSLAGDRLWGDTGVFVTDLALATATFDLDWLDDSTLAIAVADPTAQDTIRLHTVSDAGVLSPQVQVLSQVTTAAGVQAVSLADGSGGGLVAVWQETVGAGLNQVLAQRINADGSVGAPDADGDGVADALDNCLTLANADQRDTNGDGYGNLCDADLNNDNTTNVVDLGLFRQVFFTGDPDADFNGDGAVNVVDLGRMRQLFFLPPGPSGIAP
ncbi:MAG: hypothetical protein AAFU65_00895 [Pseudomonadota bacterium]